MDKADAEKNSVSLSGGSGTTEADAFAANLNFPATYEVANLSPLRDNHSAYPSVAKTCLQLNQYAMNGSSSSMEDTNSVQSSSLFHDASFVNTMGAEDGAFAALIECIQTHDDRRAKIVACKTLALIARAAYARIRHSPRLFALRESTNTRLEDEVGTDVPMALASVALEDPDDGVAAAALNALGIMTLSSSSIPGSMVEDELLREVMSIVHGRPSPHSPSLGVLQDQESNLPQLELQARIYDNVMAPRLMQLVGRVTTFDTSNHVRIVLPVLTASLVHLSKTSPPVLYGMDRTTYAKRWIEYDFVNLVNEMVDVLLLPTMMNSYEAQLALAASMSAIRLIGACPHAPWVPETSHWSIVVLKEQAGSADNEEAKLTALASLLVCSRAVPLPERLSTLEFVFSLLLSLRSTSIAPYGVNSPGLMLEFGGIRHYRRPTRVAFLTEVALSFFVDGAVDSSNSRSLALESFLRSNLVSIPINELARDGDIIQPGEEIVAAFCSVAIETGRKFRSLDGGTSVSGEKFHEWVCMSLALLKAFLPCVTWQDSSPVFMEEELNVLVAAQTNYVGLFMDLLHSSGLLKSKSVSLKMSPSASPPNMLWDQLEEAATFLSKHEPIAPLSSTELELLYAIITEITGKELRGRGVVSHHMRLFLLSFSVDQWIQTQHLSLNAGQKDLKDKMAKDLLQALSPRRIFGKLVESNKSQIDQYSKKKKESYKKYAQETITVCVALIENLALFVCNYKGKFGKSPETTSILNHAIASLQGKSDAESDAPVLPVCKAAIDRIQTAVQSSRSLQDGPSFSLLIPPGPLKRRPVVTASRSQQSDDAYNVGYLMQLTRQIVATRIDSCLLSFPSVYPFPAAARKQNWLRLNLPPLPSSRNPKLPVTRDSEYSWGSQVRSLSGGSDAAAVALSHSMRRILRYDGEEEFRFIVSMRVHNITAVVVPDGVRLELGIHHENAATSADAMDAVSQDVYHALAESNADPFGESSLTSATALYKPELKSGEHITWEVALDVLPMTGSITINPSIVFRSMEQEPTHASWIGGENKDDIGDGENSSTGKGVKGSRSKKQKGSLKEHLCIPCEPILLSPMIGLQPCPFVFFRDGSGDVDSFRFLWSRVPYQVPPMKVGGVNDTASTPHNGSRLAAISTLRFRGEAIPGGLVTKLWAFMSLGGKRALFVMAESEDDKTIHIRGDDKSLLSCLVGTKKARCAVAAALEPGSQPLEV
ncbi:unnamed protein product [Cylindrotheca closterium]|uniref:Uncharacterized protein n=1 Tax=Cylindrotheca closterium TaxID=2856 RepID=A0AAD2CGD8_9STRA|nr:unnamed protein product [Cylindrotheca closterium]